MSFSFFSKYLRDESDFIFLVFIVYVIMRCDENDPLYQVTFEKDGSFTKLFERRVGRPRGHWTETTVSEVLKETEEDQYERGNTDQILAGW